MFKVAVITGFGKDIDWKYTKQCVTFLAGFSCMILLPAEFAGGKYKNDFFSVARERLVFLPEKAALRKADLCLVLGGDGTIISTAKYAANCGTLVLGINLGRIGYIAELEIHELALLQQLFQRLDQQDIKSAVADCGFSVESRMMIQASVVRGGKQVDSSVALNDVVISKGSVSRMIDITLCQGEKEMMRYRADGLIVSTPTGSTAYCMSAGGPMIDPSIACMCAIPVCPFMSLYSGPIIFSHDSSLNVVFHSEKGTKAYFTVDGQGGKPLEDGDVIHIEKSKFAPRLLRVKQLDFYKVLASKFTGAQLPKLPQWKGIVLDESGKTRENTGAD